MDRQNKLPARRRLKEKKPSPTLSRTPMHKEIENIRNIWKKSND